MDDNYGWTEEGDLDLSIIWGSFDRGRSEGCFLFEFAFGLLEVDWLREGEVEDTRRGVSEKKEDLVLRGLWYSSGHFRKVNGRKQARRGRMPRPVESLTIEGKGGGSPFLKGRGGEVKSFGEACRF